MIATAHKFQRRGHRRTNHPAGNATEELVKNSGGALALQIRRTISALNRVQSETWGAGITETYTQDANGRLASVTDALGLPSRIVDAIARATDITRDALGRPTLITHSPASGTPAGTTAGKTHTTELRYDLTGTTCNATNQPSASKGRLCEMVDRVDGVEHVKTQYQWDAFGRLTRQMQTLSSAIANHSTTQTTAFAYRTSGGGKGELATITYPSGAVLTHQYNAAGRLSGMLWNGQLLLQAITWNALGQPLSWRWEFADASTTTRVLATRLYNTAGQLTSSEFATFAPETTGRIGSVSQKLVRAKGTGGWLTYDAPFNALYNSLGLHRRGHQSALPVGPHLQRRRQRQPHRRRRETRVLASSACPSKPPPCTSSSSAFRA